MVSHRLARCGRARFARLPVDVLPRPDTGRCSRQPLQRRAASGRAHAAIADPARGALLHDERVPARAAGIGRGVDRGHRPAARSLALRARCGVGPYLATIPARGFELQFTAIPTQPLLLQGRDGFSKKGPSRNRRATTTASRSSRSRRRYDRTPAPLLPRTRVARPRVVEQRARSEGGRIGTGSA